MSGKILRATIEACKGVTNKKIDFKGKQILALIGDGATGKTSLVEFFKAIVTGKIEPNLINQKTGKMAGNAEIEKDGQVYQVRLSRTKKSETVEVKSPNNMRGGKEVLRQLVGTVAIDPFALARLDLSDQVKEFKKMMRVDTAELDKIIKEEVGERETLGRIVRQLDGAIKDDPNNRIEFEQHKAKYAEEMKLGDLPDKLRDANEKNRQRLEKLAEFRHKSDTADRMRTQVREIEAQIEQLKNRLKNLNSELQQTLEQISELDQWTVDNPEVPVEPIQAEIDEINKFNQERASLQAYFEKVEYKQQKEKEYEEQRKRVRELEEKRADLIKQATTLIPDFEFREKQYDADGKLIDDREGPYYRGVPISALSHTELVIFAINFKRALDKGLPVIIVDDLESVGSEGRKALEDLCQQGVCQAIVSYMDAKTPDLKIVLKNTLDFSPGAEEEVLEQSIPVESQQTQNKTNGSPISQPDTHIPAVDDISKEEQERLSRESLRQFEQQNPQDNDAETHN